MRINTGDRVRMRDGEPGWMGVPLPDLGEGTVVATTGEFLMEGMYVEVEWDEYHGTLVNRPSIQSLEVIS